MCCRRLQRKAGEDGAGAELGGLEGLFLWGQLGSGPSRGNGNVMRLLMLRVGGAWMDGIAALLWSALLFWTKLYELG